MPKASDFRLAAHQVDGQPGFLVFRDRQPIGRGWRIASGWRCEVFGADGVARRVFWPRRTYRQAVERITGCAT